MKYLVTGGAGFVGTNLIKRLVKDGHEVVSVDNYSTGKEENHQDGCMYHKNNLSSDHILGIYVDAGTYPSWRDESFDLIFHLAALPRIMPSFKDPVATYKSGPVATINILDLAKKNKTPVIYSGSSSCAGDVYANPYTFSKWQNEELMILYNKLFNVPMSICRFYNVYGEHQATEGSYCNVLGTFEKQHREGEPLTITGDGEQRRDFTYVGDIVDGLVRCADGLLDVGSDSVNGESFELGNGKNYSINELVEAFGNYPSEYIDARPGEMRETLNIDTKAQETLGWQPKGDIIEYIKKTWSDDEK